MATIIIIHQTIVASATRVVQLPWGGINQIIDTDLCAKLVGTLLHLHWLVGALAWLSACVHVCKNGARAHVCVVVCGAFRRAVLRRESQPRPDC